MRTKSILVLPLVLCALAGLYFSSPAVGKDDPASKAAPAIPVKTVAAARKDAPVTIKAVGTVVPMQTVAVKSRIDSQIMEVKFHDGDNVKKGDVLFILDDRVLKSELTQTNANLQRDKTQLENFRRQNERTEKLAGQGYATGATRDDAKTALDSQIALVAADQAALENIRVQLGYTVITAPIDGRTGTINVTVGNNIKANDAQPLVTINQIQPVQVQSALPQNSFDALRQAITTGDVAVAAKRDGSEKATSGKLKYIDNAIDQGTGTFVARSVFENTDEGLWPGMLVNLTITLREDKDVIVVPEVAIQHTGSGDFVYTITNGQAKKTPVTVARMQDGSAIITDGLQGDEPVVIDGQMSLKDGSTVTTQ